jgi:hypothetical protein
MHKYSPLAKPLAKLLPFENPIFSLFSISLTSGNNDFTMVQLSSEELLSITMISEEIPFKEAWTLCKHSSKKKRTL